jgi:hypothetical protein
VKSGPPSLSVILVTPDDFATVRRTFQHLRAQTVAERIEVVLVAPRAADVVAGSGEVDGFHSMQVVETAAPITSSAAARAVGIRAAHAPVVALGEDHSFPDPGWAAALLSAHARGHAVVGPTVRNGNPGTMLSWANLLLEYGPWLDPADAGPAEHLPGHNSSYKRELLLSYGDELPQRMQVETMLQQELASRGHTLLRTADARTAHLNFSRFLPSLPLRFLGGRLFASGRARGWSAGKRTMYMLGAPLIPLVRLRRIVRTMARVPEQRALLPRILPMLWLTLLVDAAGELVGYALGAGRSDAQLSAIEFRRPRFLNARDRADYESALRGAGT